MASDQRPSDIENYAGVRDTPLVLGAVLALLAVGTLAHVLFTGVRRRRRDLAVLKTLGLLRSQLLRVVSLAGRRAGRGRAAGRAAAGPAGGPLGVAAVRRLGRRRRATPTSRCRWWPLVIPVTLVLAILLAAVPGWTAARIRPALILRSE